MVSVIAGLAFSMSAHAMNCEEARSAVEKAVCSTCDLNESDERLNKVYVDLAERLSGDTLQKLRAQQRAWLRKRDACGADCACLKTSYESRSDALQQAACEGGAFIIRLAGRKKAQICKVKIGSEIDGTITYELRGRVSAGWSKLTTLTSFDGGAWKVSPDGSRTLFVTNDRHFNPSWTMAFVRDDQWRTLTAKLVKSHLYRPGGNLPLGGTALIFTSNEDPREIRFSPSYDEAKCPTSEAEHKTLRARVCRLAGKEETDSDAGSSRAEPTECEQKIAAHLSRQTFKVIWENVPEAVFSAQAVCEARGGWQFEPSDGSLPSPIGFSAKGDLVLLSRKPESEGAEFAFDFKTGKITKAKKGERLVEFGERDGVEF